MRIEDAIHVQGFPSKQQRLSINLIYTTSWADVQHQEFFGAYGLTSSQYNVLRILRGHHPNPVTTSTIWERMIHRNAGARRCTVTRSDRTRPIHVQQDESSGQPSLGLVSGYVTFHPK